MKRLSLCLLITLLSLATLVGCGGSSSNISSPTPAQIVATDKAGLAVGYASGDTSSSITQSLTLPTSGSEGSTITWNSSNPTVISNAGAVNRPLTGDANVTLTATITMSGASDTKVFPVTVKAQMTDADAVAAAKSALALAFATGDSAASVTKNLTLPSTGLDNSTVTWSSSDPSVITNAGVVHQPNTGESNVTLTATITVGSVSDTKQFPLVVKPLMSDAQAVAAAKADLAIGFASGDSASSVSKDVSLPTTGLYGTTITWASNDTSTISNTGVVHQPDTGDNNVILTATITLNTASDTNQIPLVVKPKFSDAAAVADAKANLAITFASGDTAASVTKDVTLPVSSLHGTSVSWASSDTSTISNAGVVHQPDTADASVNLTATITLNAASDSRQFPLVVKPKFTDAAAVADAKSTLAINFASGDSAASVTKDVTLPGSGSHGTTVTWSSNNGALISNAGVVHQPDTGDASLILTATITLNAVSDTKTFPLTVKALMTDIQAVADAKNDLAIGYASGDADDNVTKNVSLTTSGLHNTTVSWSSDNAAIAGDGTVSRPDTGDAPVILTATITLNAASDTKTFPVTVKAKFSDAEAVAAAKADLAIGYASGDASTTVTQNLTLPTSELYGTTVSWSTTDTAIGSDGAVSRPVTGDVPVTLTATISLHAASDTRNFIVTVKAQMTDAEAVAAAKQALQIVYQAGDSAASVSQNLGLPLTGSSGCTVSWGSTDPAVSSDGTVTPPSYGDVQVTLTATISSHAISDTASFVVTVKGRVSDADAVAAAKAALDIAYASGDSASSVTQNVILAATGVDACSIAWSSDTPATIDNTGVVTQPTDNDVIVTLTATISSHSVSDTKQFALTVKAPSNDAAAVAADKAALTIVYGPGDSISSVQHNIVLPTSGTNGSDIGWASSNPGIISSSGGVTVPTDTDANVTMTATIHKGTATDTRTFDMTVKALLLSSWVNVNAISPGNGAIEVDPGIVVRIPFQFALDASTVNNSFQLYRTSDSQLVPVDITYDASSYVVSLTPQSPLGQDVQYTTVVLTSLKNLGGSSLPSPMGFNFSTLSYDDILSQWKFNGDGSDSSGNNHLFTAFDMMAPANLYDATVEHEGTGSLYLDGAWQYGQSNINLGHQLTVAVWVNVDNPIQEDINTIMSNTGTGEESNGFKLCINRWETSDRAVVIEVGDGATGGKWTTAQGLIQPGPWYHVAFVIDQPNKSIKIYYNGAEAQLTFASDEGFTENQFNYSFNTAGPFTIGGFPGGMDYNFKGHLDDMRVYNRVLSPEEIAKIAKEK